MGKPITLFERARSPRATAAACASTLLATLPVYLLGAAAPLFPAEWRMEGSRLGTLAFVFFAGAAVVSMKGGSLADTRGARLLLLVGAAASVSALRGVSLLATGYWLMVVFLVLAGIANGIAQPAGNVVLEQHVSAGSKGVAFGLKVAAVPLATATAGALVALVGTQHGWRYCFLLAVVPVVFVLLVPRKAVDCKRGGTSVAGSAVRSRALILLAVAAASGAAANTGLGTFYVSAVVDGGVSGARAALLVTIASVGGVIVRIGSGMVVDRWRIRSFTAAAVLLAGGLVGVAVKALNNMLSAVNLAAAVELLLAGRHRGVDPATALAVLNVSTGRNHATETKVGQHVLSGTFDSGFRLALMLKDLRIAADLVADAGLSGGFSDVCRELWEDAARHCGADADSTEAMRRLADRVGVHLAEVEPSAAPTSATSAGR